MQYPPPTKVVQNQKVPPSTAKSETNQPANKQPNLMKKQPEIKN